MVRQLKVLSSLVVALLLVGHCCVYADDAFDDSTEDDVVESPESTKLAFYKSHKTGSSTFGAILARVAATRNLTVWPTYNHYLKTGVTKWLKDGVNVNLVMQHVQQDKAKPGKWFESVLLKFYTKILGPDYDLFTTVREPVSLWLSNYFYFVEPEAHAPLPMAIHKGLGANRLAHDFDVLTFAHALDFVKSDAFKRLNFVPIEKVDFVLGYFAMQYGWSMVDLLYEPININKGGKPRWHGDTRKTQKPPSVSDLSNATIAKIEHMNYLDMFLYGAAVAKFSRWEDDVKAQYPNIDEWVEAFQCLRNALPDCDVEEPDVMCEWLAMDNRQYEAMFLNDRGRANHSANILETNVLIGNAISAVRKFVKDMQQLKCPKAQ